ncbi:DNRLRE domain-containing protein [Actinocrispum sp. NPDC049592]|uniref:DNRLRE domain-containing protein n=1 Tax=Actinocrispum sp. NPDC049592 TaxID=3154835 RepID=UPI0034274F15
MLPERRSVWSLLLIFCVVATGLVVPAGVTHAAPAPVVMQAPGVVRANGAQLRWSIADAAGFTGYQVHRSTTANFTPSADTLLTTITDREVTRWTDTTAAPAKTFRYKVVTGTAVSPELPITTTAAGQARVVVTPADGSGAATYVTKDTTAPQGCADWNNYGSAPHLRVGADTDGTVHRGLVRFDLRDIPVGAQITSATLSLSYGATTAPVGATSLQRITRDWKEGKAAFPGSCDGSGASWLETQGGVRWTADGVDTDPALVASIPARSRTTAGKDTVDIAGVVRQWVAGQAPNHGLLVKAVDEKVPATGHTWLDYASDDATDTAARPTLDVTFSDSSQVLAPAVAITAPAPDSVAEIGDTTLRADAGDDSRVTKVDFKVDGALVGSDTTAPYEVTAKLVEGDRTITAVALDDAGNSTTSPPAKVKVRQPFTTKLDNQQPKPGDVVRGDVWVTGRDWGNGIFVPVDVMQILVDGVVVASTRNCGQVPDGAECTDRWDSLNPLRTWEDGEHEITTRLVALDGRISPLSDPVKVVLDNDTADDHRVKLTVNDPATTDDDAPPVMKQNASPTLPVQDPYAGKADPVTGISPGSLGRSLSTSPVSMLPAAPPADCPADAFCAKASITNEGKTTWDGKNLQLWYRWIADNGAVLLEQQADQGLPPTLPPGQTATVPVTVQAPKLPPGADAGKFELRLDLYDVPGKTWFSSKGNEAVSHQVALVKDARDMLGLERFWQYESEDLGAGMTSLTNLFNGNGILRWSPFFAPGRGLSTSVDLTYNSLEDHSKSPAGNNFSLSVGGLTRLGERLEVTGLLFANGVELVDGDGTRLRFDRVVANGQVRWQEPPGVNLYLRELKNSTPDRHWAVTRPDEVTYWFDQDGYPTAVTDRNNNTTTYELEKVPPLEDLFGPAKRIRRVVDPGGRAFTIDYYSRDEVKQANIRGKIQRITDHTGSALDFTYYEDGNLLRLTQAGGIAPTGTVVPDRSFVFTYTTYSGDDPAIEKPGDRVNPDPRTRFQSTRVYSVRDPRGFETSFDYYSPSEDVSKRWRLQTRANRNGQLTSFDYDLNKRVTTVFAPEDRVSRYGFDSDGKPLSITNALNETTAVEWTPDFKVSRVTEPTKRATSYTYNANGYLTSQTDQLNQRTELTYIDKQADAADPAKHLSLLETVTKPKGTVTPVADDFRWRYTYDGADNLDTVTDPSGAVTDYNYSGPGTAAPGTIASQKDPNGGSTSYPAYDPSGQPLRMVDPLGKVTQFGYDADGLMRWLQDPNHANDSGADERSYRTFFDYDPFHRLERQSAPKSTSSERGQLVWSSVRFDANDNIVQRVDPHYGHADAPGTQGPTATATYDNMDQPVVVSNPDKSVDPAGERFAFQYDAAGRLVKQTKPLGVLSATVPDDYTSVYSYDKLDRPTREVRFGANTSQARYTHMCYDLAGDLVSVTSPRAKATSAACPATGGQFTTTYAYDAAHQRVSQTDPIGMAQRFTYDANGNVVSYERDIAPGRSTRQEIEFDQRDLQVLTRTRFDGGRNLTTRTTYDANGNRKTEVSPHGSDAGKSGPFNDYVTSFDYDARNQMVRVTLPSDAADGTQKQYVHNEYDANGNVAWTSLPVSLPNKADVRDTAKTVTTYFDPGWIRTSKESTGPTVRFDYLAQGWQQTRTPDQQGSPGQPDTARRVDWTYFDDGQLRTRQEFQGQPSTYTYDANDNLTKAVDARGSESPDQQQPTETENTYTGFDEIAKTRIHKRGEATWRFSTYSYDENGNVIVRSENGEENDAGTQTKAPRRHELSYGDNDWLSSQLDLGTDGACKDDQRITTTFWGDGWQRQQEIFRAADGCSADPASWPKQQTTTWDYFDNGKLRNLVTRNGSGEVTESHDVGYLDDNGNYVNGNRTTDRFILKRAEGKNATTCVGPSTCLAKYTYDARDKLTRHQKREGKVTTYDLDQPDKLDGDNTIRAGNVTTEHNDKGEEITKRYEGSQLRKMTLGGVSVENWYDPNGNLDCLTLEAGSGSDCSRSGGAPASPNVVTDYAYDNFDRLLNTRQFAGGAQTDATDYSYDALDRTVKEKEDHNGGGKDRTTDFTYQGLTKQVTEEKQSGGDNPRTKSFSYDTYGHRIAMGDKDNASGQEDKYTYSHDVQGSVSQLIGAGGKVKASYGYDAYGGSDADSNDQETLSTGDTDNQAPVNPYRYSGRRMDSGSVASSTTPPVPAGSASYDMGARRYGPNVGQFQQRDAYRNALADLGLALDPLTQNRYSLAGGNPVSFVEYDGHWPDLGGIGDAIKEGVNKATNAVKDALGKAGDAVKSATNAAGEAAGKAANAVGKAASDTANKAGQAANDVAKATQNKANEIGEKAKQLGSQFQEAAHGAAFGKGLDTAEAVHESLDNAKGVAEGLGKGIEQFTEKAKSKVGQALNKGSKAFNKFAESPGAKFTGRFLQVAGVAINFAKHYNEGDKALTAAAKTGIESGSGIAAGAAAGAAGGAIGGPVGAAIGGLVGGAVGGIAGEAVVKKFEKPIEEGTSKAQDWLGDKLGLN